MHAMEQHKPITIFGDGSQTRDFICVHDVVYNNLLLGSLPSSTLHTYKLNAEPINIAHGQPTSIYELFLSLKKAYPSYDYSPTFTAARSGDITHSHANCQKLAMIQKYYAA
jgi:UDP-glucose 4-epimerase